jgi:hypothetical protein
MKSGRVKVEFDKRGQSENSECFSRIFASESEKGRNAEEKEKEEEKAKDCSELPSIQRGKGSEPY